MQYSHLIYISPAIMWPNLSATDTACLFIMVVWGMSEFRLPMMGFLPFLIFSSHSENYLMYLGEKKKKRQAWR